MKEIIKVLTAGIILVFLFAIIAAADNGKEISNNEPSFMIPDNSGQLSSAGTNEHVFIAFRSKPGHDNIYGFGLVNASAAVEAALSP